MQYPRNGYLIGVNRVTCGGYLAKASAVHGASILRGPYFSIFAKQTSVPDGYGMGGATVHAYKAGNLSSYNQTNNTLTVSSTNLAGGKNGVAPLTGAGDIPSASINLIVSAVAALVGSGAVTSAIVGKLEAAAALAGSGALAGALGALAGLTGPLTGTGEVTASATAKAAMSSAIVVSGDILNTANVGPAVWISALEGAETAGEIMRILRAFAAGNGTFPPSSGSFVMKAADGTTDRIAGTVNAAGARTVTSVNGT